MDNLILNLGSGGPSLRTFEDANNVHWPASVLAYGDSFSDPNNFQVVTQATGLPVAQSGTWLVGAGQSGVWSVRNQDGSGNALTSMAAGSHRAMAVAIVDGSGNQITTFGNISTFASAFPSTGTPVGFTDGSNFQPARVFDADTGAGSQYVLGVGIRLSASGGSVEGGTATNPIRTDPTGTTIQPVSGTVTIQDGAGAITVDNAGTFAVQASQTGTWNVGTVATITNPVTVQNGGTFAVQASQAGNWAVRNQDGTGNALTSISAGSQRPLTVAIVDASGTHITSLGSSAVFGATFPANGTPVGASNPSGNMAALKVDASGNLNVNVSGGSISAGVAGTPSIDVVSVQGIASMTPIMVSQSGNWSVRNQDGLGNNLTSLSVGSHRAITVAMVDASGNQITSLGSSAVFGATFPANGTPVGASNPSGNMASLKVDASGNLNVNMSGGGIASGVAGTPSTDVVSIQGIASMTPISVSQSGTWNVGTVTTITNSVTVVNAGTFAVQAAQSGNWAVRNQDGTGNALTSISAGSQRPLSVAVVDASGAQITSFNGGTVIANAGTNLNTSALALESGGNLATIAGAVRAEDAVASAGHTGIPVLAVRKATPANTSSADGDYERLQMSAGRLWVDASGKTLVAVSTDEGSQIYMGNTPSAVKYAVISASTSGDNVIVAAVAGKKIRVIKWNVSASNAVNIKWRRATTDITGLHYLAQYSMVGGGYSKVGHFETAVNQDLNLNLSGNVAVGGSLAYIEY